MKTVYWSYSIGDNIDDTLPSDYVPELIPYRKGYDPRYDHSKCPAFKEYTKNMWLIRQPFDLGMIYKSEDKYLQSNLGQFAFHNYFHMGEKWLDGEYPELQMKYVLSLWTEDKDVWVEQVPHPLLSRYGLDLVPGTFPISVWFRPLVAGVKLLDFDTNLWIPKGTPLYYVRFCSKKSNADFKIEHREPPHEKKREQSQHNMLRTFSNFDSWDIITSRVEKESKCPFSGLWKR